MTSFWQSLPKPFFSLAPMADVTDPAYRSLIAEASKGKETSVPFVTWTEFVSADGLYHTREKKGMPDEENPLMRDLIYVEAERPIVAQFFSGKPEMIEYAAALAVELGFDGFALNMGCPDKSIEKQGAGAGHIKNPENAREVVRAALRGTKGKIPVCVKTRLGYNRIEYQEWLPYLLSEDIAVLTLHLRTRKEMSAVPAHWELGREIAEFCRGINPNILLEGNGDVPDIETARKLAEESTFDGVMLGRAIFGNPWLFSGRAKDEITPDERLQALADLAERFHAMRPGKHHAILKKHFKAFISGWDGAAELRAKLMETNSLEEFKEVLGK